MFKQKLKKNKKHNANNTRIFFFLSGTHLNIIRVQHCLILVIDDNQYFVYKLVYWVLFKFTLRYNYLQ